MRSAVLPTLTMVVASLGACSSSPTEPATASAPLDATSAASTTQPADTSSPVPAAPDSAAPDGGAETIIGPVWWLTGARDGDETLLPKTSIFRRARFQIVNNFGCDAGECRDGLTLVGNDACNDFVSDVVLTESTITLGGDREMTAVGCDDELTSAFGRVLAAPIDVAVEDDSDGFRLVLTSPDRTIELAFRTDTDPFGPTSDAVVTDGRVDDFVYRITWEGPDGGGGTGGVVEFLDTTVTAFQRHAIGIGISEDFPLDANLHRFGNERLLFGVAPIEAARVEYSAAANAPVELTLFDVPDSDARVFAEPVENADTPWTVVGFNANGVELIRVER